MFGELLKAAIGSTRIALTRNALEAAFVEADVRRTLLDRLQIAALSLGAPGASH